MYSPSDGTTLSAAQKRKARLRRTAIAKSAQSSNGLATQQPGAEQHRGAAGWNIDAPVFVPCSREDSATGQHLFERYPIDVHSQLWHLRQLFVQGMATLDALLTPISSTEGWDHSEYGTEHMPSERDEVDTLLTFLGAGSTDASITRARPDAEHTRFNAHLRAGCNDPMTPMTAAWSDQPNAISSRQALNFKSTYSFSTLSNPIEAQTLTSPTVTTVTVNPPDLSMDLATANVKCPVAEGAPSSGKAFKHDAYTFLHGADCSRSGDADVLVAQAKDSGQHDEASIKEFYDMAQRARINVPFLPSLYGRLRNSTAQVAWQPMLMLTWPSTAATAFAVKPVGQSCAVLVGGPAVADQICDRDPTSDAVKNELYGLVGLLNDLLWSDDPSTPLMALERMHHYMLPLCRYSKAARVLALLAYFQPLLAGRRIQVKTFGLAYDRCSAPYVAVPGISLSGGACHICGALSPLAVITGDEEVPPCFRCTGCIGKYGGIILLELRNGCTITLLDLVGNWSDNAGRKIVVRMPPWYSGARRRGYLVVHFNGSNIQYEFRLREVLSGQFTCGPATLDLLSSSENQLKWTFADGASSWWTRDVDFASCSDDSAAHDEPTCESPIIGPSQSVKHTLPSAQRKTQTLHAGGTRRSKGKSLAPARARRARHLKRLPAASRNSQKS